MSPPLVALSTDDSDSCKHWRALIIKEYKRDVVAEVEPEWLVTLLTRVTRNRLMT